MIKIILKITIALLLLVNNSINAQEFQGKAVYQTKIKMSKDMLKRMDSSKMPEDRKVFFMKMMKKRAERVYELNFNKITSIYKQQKSLEAPSENARFNRSTNDVLFKNIKIEKSVHKKETFGKVFLINDALYVYDWTLEKETKMIGKYLCLKATAEKEIENNLRFRRFSREKNDKKKEENQKEVSKKIKVTVWYTPEIPVNNGPEKYHGLPGLILEVNAGELQILCTKIVLNPNEKVEISAPTKGKEITEDEYKKVVEKKVKEMRERYKSNRKKGGNSSRRSKHF